MSVNYDESSGKFNFKGKQWIQQDTYVFADLNNISLEDDVLSGDVYGEYASFFWVEYGDIGDVSVCSGTGMSGYRISFEHSNASLGVHEKQIIKVFVSVNGAPVEEPAKIRWFSNNEHVAKINGNNWGDNGFEFATGEISAIAPGTTEIYAEIENNRVAVCTVIVSENGTISPFAIDTSYELLSQIQAITEGDIKTYSFAPSYKITATIKNPDTKTATNAVIKINLPTNTILQKGEMQLSYAEIKPNETVDVSWDIVTTGDYYTTTSILYSISAESDQCVEITEFKTLFIDPFTGQDGQLDFSQDVWSFTNSSIFFDAGYYINDVHYNALMSVVSNIEKENIIAYLNSTWCGSCYGMSTVAALVKKGRLDISEFGTHSLKNSPTPKDSDDIYSLITYYHMTQLLDSVNAATLNVLSLSEEKRLQGLVSAVQNTKFTGMPVLLEIGYLTEDFNLHSLKNDENTAGHAVLAYGVEFVSGTVNSLVDGSAWQYDKRIAIYDPNNNQSPIYMYINNDYSKWMVGDYCQNRTKSDGLYWYKGEGYFAYIDNADVLDSENIQDSVKNYYSKLISKRDTQLLIRTGSDDGWDSEMTLNGLNVSGNDLRVIPYIMNVSSSGQVNNIGYAFLNANMVEIVPDISGETVDLKYELPGVSYVVQAESGEAIVFSDDDSATLTCDGKYVLSAIYNEGEYASPWYCYTVEGSCSGTVSLTQDAEGYCIVTGEDLANISLTVKGHNSSQTIDFSTDEDSVLIKNAGDQIVLLVDTDENGTYETPIENDVSDKVQEKTPPGDDTVIIIIVLVLVGILVVVSLLATLVFAIKKQTEKTGK